LSYFSETTAHQTDTSQLYFALHAVV